MNYIQLKNEWDAKAFLPLAKSGLNVTCLAHNIYGIQKEHFKILQENNVPFKQLHSSEIHLPENSLAA